MLATINPNPAVEVLLAIVPLLGVIFGATLIFFAILWHYRLRRELIRTGQYVPAFQRNLRKLSFLIGVLAVSAGLPLTILIAILDGVSYSLLGGLVPLCVGSGLIVYYALTGENGTN